MGHGKYICVLAILFITCAHLAALALAPDAVCCGWLAYFLCCMASYLGASTQPCCGCCCLCSCLPAGASAATARAACCVTAAVAVAYATHTSPPIITASVQVSMHVQGRCWTAPCLSHSSEHMKSDRHAPEDALVCLSHCRWHACDTNFRGLQVLGDSDGLDMAEASHVCIQSEHFISTIGSQFGSYNSIIHYSCCHRSVHIIKVLILAPKQPPFGLHTRPPYARASTDIEVS